MIAQAVLFACLLQLIVYVSSQFDIPPCTEYFQFLKNDSTNEIFGRFEVSSTVEKNAVNVYVKLSFTAEFNTIYSVEIKLDDPLPESIRRIQRGESLKYNIHFPIQKPRPVMNSLWLNNRQRCASPNALPYRISQVMKGSQTEEGDLPRVVTIFRESNHGKIFKCAGTLTSEKHAITGATVVFVVEAWKAQVIETVCTPNKDTYVSPIYMNSHANYPADQQMFFMNGLPQRFRQGVTHMNYLERDDYVLTPGVGVHKLHVRKLKWNEARKACMEEGGQLVVINSSREEEVLLAMMKKENRAEIWLGVHDQFLEGDWVTLTGESLESTGYSKWSTHPWPNQPDNYGGHQNCAVLIKSGGLDDIECTLSTPFVCEIEMC